jgi:hypothetical protein
MAVSIRFSYILMLIAQPLAIHYVFVFIPPFLQETETQKGVRYSHMGSVKLTSTFCLKGMATNILLEKKM